MRRSVAAGRSRLPWIGAALALLASTGPTPATGQTLPEVTATPEATADLFLRSVRAIRWSAAAQFIDAETLARFETTVAMLAEHDTTGEVTTFLLATDSAGLAALDPATVFARSVGALIDDMPGLMHALFDRDDQIVGPVREDEATAHVVYRTTARISGAVPEVKVLQMRRSDDGWRVLWSDELAVLETALRGVTRR